MISSNVRLHIWNFLFTILAMFPKWFVLMNPFHVHPHVVCIFCWKITKWATLLLVLPMIIDNVFFDVFFIGKKFPTFRTRIVWFYFPFFFTEVAFNSLDMLLQLIRFYFFATVRTTNHAFRIMIPIFRIHEGMFCIKIDDRLFRVRK